MGDKSEVVRLIESTEQDVETKMLWLQFPYKNDLEALFILKMKTCLR